MATAKAVVAAGFEVVATTSWAVAATLGYEDEERAPADEMFAAAARIARSVEVPVTVDAEAGYGMQPAELVAALQEAGAAGCNLEDTEWPARTLRDPDRQAEWLTAVREAASEAGYPLVVNARIDAFFHPFLADEGGFRNGSPHFGTEIEGHRAAGHARRLQLISGAMTSPPSAEASEGRVATCGSERQSNQYVNPPNTIDASHERSSPLAAREIGPWNGDAVPYSNVHPDTSPTRSAASERQRTSP